MSSKLPSRARVRAEGSIGLRASARWRGRRVGLLGGSFNPAHGGHRHVSLEALKRLGLDAVWWLVSPQNPLKPGTGMAPLPVRLQSARLTARHPRIIPSAIEQRLGTRYTIDTVAALQRLHPRTCFIWLIGSDNARQLHLWKNWRALVERVAIAVIDRRGYAGSRWSAPALARCRTKGLVYRQVRLWSKAPPPAIVMVTIPRDGTSATAIRVADPGWADRLGATARTQSVG